MFNLSNPSVLAASASVNAVVNATASLAANALGANTYDGMTPVSLGTSATDVLDPASGTMVLAKALHFFNTSTAAITLKVYYPTSSNQVYQAIIPALGTIVWTPDNGWKIYDSTGLEQKLNLKTDTFTISGSSPGPYAISNTPDGRMRTANIGNAVVPASQFTYGSGTITFTGAIATTIGTGAFNGAEGDTSYSY